MTSAPKPTEAFLRMLEQVAGAALAAAGFRLQENPTHHMRGLFRYAKPHPHAEGVTIYLEFQLLVYAEGPSRFKVTLLRNAGADARSPAPLNAPARFEIGLARLLWEGFGVAQLTGPDHWWVFGNQTQLAYALAEAGRLAFAFGVPFLEGTLAAENPIESD